MRKCVLVTERDGAYKMQPDIAPEDWNDVWWEADGIRYIEDLDGWGEWAEAWRVYRGFDTLTYFVTKSQFSPEARRVLGQVYDLLLNLPYQSDDEGGIDPDAGASEAS